MKAAMVVLSILGAAAVIFAAVAPAVSDSTTMSGSTRPIMGALNIDTRSGETKLAELQRGPVLHGDSADDDGGMIINPGNVRALPEGSSLQPSKVMNLSSNNSSAQNSSALNATALNSTALNSTAINQMAINSTALNTSALNASAANASRLRPTGAAGSGAVELSGSTEASSNGAGTSSQASMKGVYSTTASRHEMGKSDIKSKMFLSGDFNVDNSVSFQDHNFWD